MRNLVVVLIVVMSVSVCVAGYAFPIFNYDRSLWMYKDTTPIILESGSYMGLTNPHSGDTDIHFIFTTDSANFYFDVSQYESDGVTVEYVDGSGSRGATKHLFIDGTHDGPGNPVNYIYMYGDAIVDVYEKISDSTDYEKIGTFTVGNPAPEPASMVLFGLGGLICFTRKR